MLSMITGNRIVEHDDPVLDREIELHEIEKCVRKLKNNKTGGSDGLVGELLKYGGSGMATQAFRGGLV